MNTKVRCLLLDDELPGLAYTRLLCDQIPGVEVVKAFNDPSKFIAALPELDFDVCLLDIEMQGLNGLQVAGLLKHKQVVFITAYREYAAEAFDLDAVDYIRKPVRKERLEQAFSKISRRLTARSEKEPGVSFNTDRGKAKLSFDEIRYITTSDTDKRDKIVFLSGGERITLKNVNYGYLLSVLPPQQFCRINKKEVIALREVRAFSHDCIITRILSEQDEPLRLALNDAYRAEFRARIS